MRAVIQRVSKASVTIVNENGNGLREAPVIGREATLARQEHQLERKNDNGNKTPKAEISQGFLVLLGCCNDDTEKDIEWLSRKIVNLRVFDDENGVMNKSIMDVGGDILVVSQFTLWASYKKGNRPSYLRAGSHEITQPLYEKFVKRLSEDLGKPVGTGEFGAMMDVALVNDGPVTICMDSKNPE